MINGGTTVKIAIDAMGGDHAPQSVIDGIKTFSGSGHFFFLFGDREKLDPLVRASLPQNFPCEVVHSPTQIMSDTNVMSALRNIDSSSMGMAIKAVEEKKADIVISSGNTGAYMAMAKMVLGTLNGIVRPAIAAPIPGIHGKTIMLDLGANAECSLRNIVEFAFMGEALARSILHINFPTIALLNIGAENIKGNHTVKNAAEILKQRFENYIGYVEGDKIVEGKVNVIVTDGFSGNIALKSIEGTSKFLFSTLKNVLQSSIKAKIGAMLLSGTFRKLGIMYDPRIHNGAMLLGLNGLVVKSHGNSDGLAIESAIKFATNALSENILDRIQEHLKNNLLFDEPL